MAVEELNATQVDQSAFAQTLKHSLRLAKAQAARARRLDIAVFVIVIVAPAVAALIATLAATIGGNDLFPLATGVDDGGWKLACAIAAIFSFIATLCSALKGRVEGRLAQSKACVGRLLALEVALTTSHLSWPEIVNEYAAVLKDHAEFMA
jgi:hypothetical protein